MKLFLIFNGRNVVVYSNIRQAKHNIHLWSGKKKPLSWMKTCLIPVCQVTSKFFSVVMRFYLDLYPTACHIFGRYRSTGMNRKENEMKVWKHEFLGNIENVGFVSSKKQLTIEEEAHEYPSTQKIEKRLLINFYSLVIRTGLIEIFNSGKGLLGFNTWNLLLDICMISSRKTPQGLV